ncbi:DUF2309 domain-containing protein [Yeosuana marina]|uniref:DUF2309 domain-containing protein n=1 Tax=Yeosuana marina TaxID=1565536 RepID=UPI0030C89780
MNHQTHIDTSINEASKVIGKTWPLYSFVTSNPLSGYEKMPFQKAVKYAERVLGAKVFPEASMYRQAWNQGEIDENELIDLLLENGFMNTPEYYLRELETQKKSITKQPSRDLDRIMAKWLAAFMDEGLAEWEMPNKKQGFYKAWRKLVKYDSDIKPSFLTKIPKTSEETLSIILKDYQEEDYTKLFTSHLAALPGWTGYINYRTEANSLWQQKYPISLKDYLAVRLWVAKNINVDIFPKEDKIEENLSLLKLQYIWLKAWENTSQNQIMAKLKDSKNANSNHSQSVPDAQMVFCIDTRSESIRRHVEASGNYQTYGYAGFFGIAMDYESLNDGLTKKACPPIVTSAYKTSEIAQKHQDKKKVVYEKKRKLLKFRNYVLKRMKNMLPSAFGFVEGAGFYYGLSILARTLTPGFLYSFKKTSMSSYEGICEPEINKNVIAKDDGHAGIPLTEKVAIVKSAFDLMCWKQFSPLVLFVGHGSHTANNPFGSSLDCGACAATPGRHNARMLAKLANLKEVRESLRTNFNIMIPEDTIFIGAEHNTTTDDIEIFDSAVPASHKERLENLKLNLLQAQQTATKERLYNDKSVALANKKANDWSETRPEWGLAKNAGFIIGPRTLTQGAHLDGRCFLHSYQWEQDDNGKALEGIMQGPMVVTQWINNHYYFSTVDNDTFGGGSKITHNITGKFGVLQGNGGDLKMGLPLQSLKQTDQEMYHQPLRLAVFIQAPIDWVNSILSRNENLKNLLDNEWIYLTVMDPEQDNAFKRYRQDMQWISTTEKEVNIEEYLIKEEAEV